jgi:hypothetical protein
MKIAVYWDMTRRRIALVKTDVSEEHIAYTIARGSLLPFS